MNANPTPQQSSTDQAAFTIRQAVRYAGLSRSFMYQLFDTGKLARLKAGNRVLILKSDLDTYLFSIREQQAR